MAANNLTEDQKCELLKFNIATILFAIAFFLTGFIGMIVLLTQPKYTDSICDGIISVDKNQQTICTLSKRGYFSPSDKNTKAYWFDSYKFNSSSELVNLTFDSKASVKGKSYDINTFVMNCGHDNDTCEFFYDCEVTEGGNVDISLLTPSSVIELQKEKKKTKPEDVYGLYTDKNTKNATHNYTMTYSDSLTIFVYNDDSSDKTSTVRETGWYTRLKYNVDLSKAGQVCSETCILPKGVVVLEYTGDNKSVPVTMYDEHEMKWDFKADLIVVITLLGAFGLMVILLLLSRVIKYPPSCDCHRTKDVEVGTISSNSSSGNTSYSNVDNSANYSTPEYSTPEYSSSPSGAHVTKSKSSSSSSSSSSGKKKKYKK